MNKLIELKNVTKTYRRGIEEVHALNDVSLSINEGEFIAVVGPSGSGKTTLLNMIGCMDKPTAGEVIINNLKISSMNDKELTKVRSSSIGLVFQQFFLLPTLTVVENIQLPTLFGKSASSRKASELLDRVGLANRRNHLPSQLSGGEMQRTAIARALINDPKILLADEPTGNLDSKNSEKVIGILRELNKLGTTIILVTHNSELANISKRIVCFQDGRLRK